MYKKKIIILSIVLLTAPIFLPYGVINTNNAYKHNQISHAELCCCGNIASTCQNCCCSEDHAGTDNTGKHTVTITACGGTSADIITVSKLNYFHSVSAIIHYMPVATLAETDVLQRGDLLIKPHYKPPKPQLLTHFT
jgi:hypothetical protein